MTSADVRQTDSAQVIAPPPLLYLGALLAGLALHLAAPWSLAPVWGSRVVGTVLFILAAGLARWSFVVMAGVGTSASPRKTSTALVSHGPFALSRNPIYVAMTGLYLGISGLTASVWPLLFLPPLLAVMHWGVILREERYLARRFGTPYLAYCGRVRRWL